MPRGIRERLPLAGKYKDGWKYRKSRVSRDGRTVYLRCHNEMQCKGTAKLKNGEIKVQRAHSPFCHPNLKMERIDKFKEALKNSLRTHNYSLKMLYDSTSLIHSHREAARYPEGSFQSLRSFMQRCRRPERPQNQQNLREFADLLNEDQHQRLLEYADGKLTVQQIVDDNAETHVVIFDDALLRAEMGTVTKLFIDATFRVRPQVPGAYQLLTIMGVKFNHVFPFVWVLMSRKTEVAYTAVLQHIREFIMPSNVVAHVMTDFEQALRNTVRTVFPTAHITGCNVHHDRARYSKAKALGLASLIRSDQRANAFFKKLLGLAYLPAQFIAEQFEKIKGELPLELLPRFSNFFEYYQRFWLRTVRPEGFTVYGLVRRTNNAIESYHSRLGDRFGTRPGPWVFIGKY